MKLKEILLQKRYLFVDIEGVLITHLEDPQIYEDVPKFLDFCLQHGIKVFYTSNVGRLARKQIVNILRKCGIPANIEQILNPTRIALEVLYEMYQQKKKTLRVFLIGEYQHLDLDVPWIEFSHNLPVDVVVLGLSRDITYQQLNFAFKCLRNSAKLVVIGGDIYAIGKKYDEEKLYLAEGAFAKLLEHAVEIQGIYTGKQYQTFFEYALKITGAVKSDVMLIDDSVRYVTGANRFGIDALFLARTREKLNKVSKIKKTSKAKVFLSNSLNVEGEIKVL